MFFYPNLQASFLGWWWIVNKHQSLFRFLQ